MRATSHFSSKKHLTTFICVTKAARKPVGSLIKKPPPGNISKNGFDPIQNCKR
jgi:hypothetical protein